MTDLMKIGHHGGGGGRYDGITELWLAYDRLGLPASFISADHAGTCLELAQIARASGVEHNIIWRSTTSDTPIYTADPDVAARHSWQATLAELPPELLPYKDLIWIVTINEPDHWNHANWLGYFSCEEAQLALDDGFKYLAYGWSSGTPEFAHWEEPGSIEYLRLCAEHPEQLGIALHEYSYSVEDIKRDYPYLVGRFWMLFELCDQLGIPRPTTFITEWGWEYQDVPAVQDGMVDIEWAASLYHYYENIRGAMGWYLGGGYGGIADQFVQYIEPMRQLAETFLASEITDLPIDPKAPPPPMTLEEFLWAESVKEQTERGIHLNSLAALQNYLHGEQLNVVHREMERDYSGGHYVAQAGEDLGGVRPREVAVWQPGVPIWSFNEPQGPTVPPTDPLLGFRIGPPFRLPFALTSPYAVPRDYDGDGIYDDLHEGADYDILTGVADSKEPVLCGVDGVVTYAGTTGGAYGWKVIVRTNHNGIDIDLWYCHMDALYVEVGQRVSEGDQLGELGDTGGPWAEHVHLNMQAHGHGSNDPRFCIPDTVDPHPYVDMRPPAGPQEMDMARLFFPPNDTHYGDILIFKNNWGAGDERVQLQREGDISYVVKNQQYEQRLITAQFISLQVDTSPGNGQYYTVQGNWLPRYMAPGDTFRRTEQVEVFRKADCSRLSAFSWTTDLKFLELLSSFTVAESSITIPNVARLAWLVEGRIEEEYWYAVGKGLVQWKARDGRKSYTSEVIPAGSQGHNVREEIGCL